MDALSPVNNTVCGTGRLELLRDGKGIYGLIGEVPAARSHAAQKITFVLRPDIIREGGIDDGLACAALQTLPHRMSVFKHTVENILRRGLGEAMVSKTDMFAVDIVDGWSTSERTANYSRQRYWGLISRAECIANNLIGKLLEEAADPDTLRLARRFPIESRARIYRAACVSPRFRQLAETFPYLAAGLLRENSKNTYAATRDMIERGAPLRDIADICEVPMTLRKVPPGAVNGVSAKFFSENPNLVHAYMPATLPAIRRWLLAIQGAEQVGGPFVEWTARHAGELGSRLIEIHSLVSDLQDWIRACYVASASELPKHILAALGPVGWLNDNANGAQFIARQFNPGMSLATVLRLSGEWHEAVANGDHQNNYEFPEPWCPAGSVNGYEITPITNGADLYREGKAMHHCVGTYSANVVHGSIYIYSLREAGERVATFELVRDDNRVRLGQVRGPCNKNVNKKIVAGVRRWLRQQKSFTFPAPPKPRSVMVGDPGYGYAANNLDDEIPF